MMDQDFFYAKKKGTQLTLNVLAILCAFVLLSSVSWAQTFSNDWIDFNQSYYKIQTASDGIYRINHQDLIDADFPVDQIDPRRIQLFHRGIEQAIFISGEEDANFDTDDFIEFYGQRNDGTLDADLYNPTDSQPHDRYNLYSDTTAYFLTYKLLPEDGKRMEFFSENNVDGLPAEAYQLEENEIMLTSNYSQGRHYPLGGIGNNHLAAFHYGEGWTGPSIRKGEFRDYTFSDLEDLSALAVAPSLSLVLSGRNNRAHAVEIFVGGSTTTLRSLGEIFFDFHNTEEASFEIEWTDIVAGELIVRVDVKGFDDENTDFISASLITLNIPQSFDMTDDLSKALNLTANTFGKSYIEITNSPASADVYDITNKNEPIRIGSSLSGTTRTVIIDNTTVERRIFVDGETPSSSSLGKVTFRELDPASHNYVVISHPLLMQPAGAYSDPVKAYAEYRASSAGGDYDTLLVSILDLYNQFNYGEKSPRAIYEFTKFMYESDELTYLYLVGKALAVNQSYYRNPNNPNLNGRQDLVPTGGLPGSDILYTAGLGDSEYGPAMPTGRLSATSAEHVANYLDKVKEMEATAFDELWRKNLVHLSGGQTATELVVFKQFVQNFERVAEDVYLGGDVKTLSKTTNSSVELINIADEVNNGLNLITFYGHSAGQLTDIEIGNVTNDQLGYNNKGKYPMIMVNGCSAGNIFANFTTFGEDWLLAKDRGALGFLSHSSTGVVGPLRNYTDVFYQTGYGDSLFIPKSIGIINKETVERFLDLVSSAEVNISQAQEVVLQGDPAVKLFGADKPDYEINENNVFLDAVEDAAVTALSDTFNVALIVRNFGIATDDSITLSLSRTLSNGEQINYDSQKFTPVFYQDTLYFAIGDNPQASFGNNVFEIAIDDGNAILELNETNNIITFNAFIPLNGTANISPIDYSILADQSVRLLAQSTDPLEGTRDFSFEIDTVSTFSSPFLMTNTVNSRTLSEWRVNILADDSVVYYWRTKYANPQPEEDTTWTSSSFIYIQNGPEGWSQAHYQQFDEDRLEGIERDLVTRQWKFIETETSLLVTTQGTDNAASGPTGIDVQFNNLTYSVISPGNRLCRTNSINGMAFDKSTTAPYVVLNNGNFDVLDPRRCGRVPQVINNLTNVDVQGGSLWLNQFVDGIGDGDFAVLFSIGNLTYSTWPQSVFDKLEEIGVDQANLAALTDGEPVIILGKKGEPVGSAIFISGDLSSGIPVTEQEITLSEAVVGKFTNGKISSVDIGPASTWESFYNNVKLSETPQTDNNFFDIFGITPEGDEILLENNVDDGEIDIDFIDASIYPKLRLEFNTTDLSNLTPGQLKKWQVSYVGVPEGVLVLKASDNSELSNLQKQEGEQFETEYQFINISNKTFADTLKVDYSIFNSTSRSTEEETIVLPNLNPGDTATFSVPINTLGKVGENDLRVFANPEILAEHDYDNNIIDLKSHFTVKADNVNPVLDVAFDGIYILDGDIVSPSPLISIIVKDENPFLLKNDTTGMEVFLKEPCEGCNFERIPFTDASLSWTAATENKDFEARLQLSQLPDGLYGLRVQAADESGNVSGAQPYTVNFEVVNESRITNFYPYPNPFSTSMRFVFTLTGSEIPDQIKIQIMTVTGKVVREVFQDELGAIHVGNNISEFAWDGRDEFGERLANGVYLYKVTVRANGQSIENRQTSADDRAFKKGYGKIYILR